jgi:hypothetical protein
MMDDHSSDAMEIFLVAVGVKIFISMMEDHTSVAM